MRYLVVGDAGSIFIKQYIEYVLLDEKNEIVLLKEGYVSSDYLNFYDKNNVKIEPLTTKRNKIIMRIPIIRSILGTKIWCVEMAKKYGQFDFLHVHGLDRGRGNIAKYLRSYAKKIAISVWGDEIFRKKEKELKKYRKYYSLAKHITVSTKAMLEKFSQTYGDEYKDKISLNKFAIGEFEFIDQAREKFTREEICQEFGVPNPEKKLIFVGHNGRDAQRHIELTKALHALTQEELSNICLIYTMTYGVKDEKYLEDLEKEAQILGCEYVILREFLNEEKIAKLRLICDILLHAQLTDAFSASIQESLYAGAIVLNGAWLQYTDLPNDIQCLIEYTDFEEMIEKIHAILKDYNVYKERFKGNRDILRNISSIEITTNAWKQALEIK